MNRLIIDVRDKVVLITGGSQGIGKHLARSFAASGSHVVVADLVKAESKSPKSSETDMDIEFVETDVTDEKSVENMVFQAISLYGRIDILINNAGVIYKSRIEDIDIEAWIKVLNVNLTGAVLCTKKVTPILKKQEWGRIINISSMQVFLGSPTYSAYTATKAGLSALTRVWAAELAPYHITVNAICPSYVDTPMMTRSINNLAKEKGITVEEAKKIFTDPIPQKRILNPEEIAFTALFLSSSLAQGITGHDMVVDGGRVMR